MAIVTPTMTAPPTEGATKWWTRWLDPSGPTLAVLLLAPTALLLGLIIVYPVIRLIWTSFHNLSLTSGAPASFSGLENYRLMIDDPVFWETTWNTVLIALITVPGALLVGLALALMANMPFKVKWPIRLSLLIPWALPLAFAGLIFAWFFHSEYGIVNDILRRLGIPGVIWFNSAELGLCSHLPHDHLEDIFIYGARSSSPVYRPFRGRFTRRRKWTAQAACASSSKSHYRCLSRPSS